MESIGIFLNSQPFIALFLVIGLGYAVGQIKIGGLSLGIGAVLFVGLGVGAIAPKAAPPGLLGTVGLVLFLYGIGIQYGRDFFKGLMSPLGIKANLLATFAVLAGCAAAIAMARFMGFGADSLLHTAKILRLSEDLPVIVEFVDTPERMAEFLPVVQAMVVKGTLVLQEARGAMHPPPHRPDETD